MIVPQSRLLFWVAVLVLPFGALGIALPVFGTFSLALIAGLAIIALVDAVQAWERLSGIAVELPAVVRLTKDRSGNIPLQLSNPRQLALPVRLGLAFPREVAPASEDLQTSLPAGVDLARLNWPCTAHKRGVYPLQACYLEALSPLGFWAKRETRPIKSELRVYPNLFIGDNKRWRHQEVRFD
jgi:uncharacterized protein (DUF58 family)